jgi:tRNA(Arg) A34 adenosine deaminase TadA
VNLADPFGLQACPPNTFEAPGACLSVTGAIGGLVGATVAPIVKGLAGLFAGARAAQTARLASEAEQIHSVLDPIARSRRTTALLETSRGKIAAGGARDLTPAQREIARQLGATPVALQGAHAEVTALNRAMQAGLKPDALAIYGPKPICPACAAAITASGGKLTSSTTAVWP